MKIATITINEYPTLEEQTAIVTSGGSLDVEIIDVKNGNIISLNVASLLAQGQGAYFVQTFKHADFELNKTKTSLKILQTLNNFVLSGSQLTDATGNTSAVASHSINLLIRTNNGSVSNPITETIKTINIADNIVKADKDELTAIGLNLTGVTWSDFTIAGKSEIRFVGGINTVFVKDKEVFLTT